MHKIPKLFSALNTNVLLNLLIVSQAKLSIRILTKQVSRKITDNNNCANVNKFANVLSAT